MSLSLSSRKLGHILTRISYYQGSLYSCLILCRIISTCRSGGGGEHSNTSVVHTQTQRNAKKWLAFWDWLWFARISIGVKTGLFQGKGSFLNSIKGCLGVIFKLLYSTKHIPKKSSWNSCLGVFFLKGANLHYGMFWKPLVPHVYNISIQVAPQT